MHSTKLNYLYEGDLKKKQNNQDIFGQSNNHKSSSGASFSSFPPLNNDCSDNSDETTICTGSRSNEPFSFGKIRHEWIEQLSPMCN